MDERRKKKLIGIGLLFVLFGILGSLIFPPMGIVFLVVFLIWCFFRISFIEWMESLFGSRHKQ